MAQLHVAAESAVSAPAEQVYTILADYREGHPAILPAAFSDFVVEEGGRGAGTVMRFKMAAGGRVRRFHQRVAEPQPGRTLTESDLDSSLVTTFTVVPAGAGSRVQIETTWDSASGLGGLLERLFAPRMIRAIYAQELANLDRYAQEHARGGGTL